jgi:1-acyl-sn-glycerol-3-phosphate acyltransferase
MATRSLPAPLPRRPSRPGPSLPAWPRAPWCCHLREQLQRRLLFPAMARVCPAEVVGAETLDGLPRPLLLVANHTSHLDTPCLLAALPPALRRRTAVAAAADYWFRDPLLAAAVALGLNIFPLQRRAPAMAALRACGDLSAAGWTLLLYPEGTRSPDGRLGTFRPGIGHLAAGLGVPVVPVHLDGPATVLPKGRRWPRTGRARVRFGAPLAFGRETSPRAATMAIEAAVRALAQQAQGGLPGRM